jgi:hypothetical protein
MEEKSRKPKIFRDRSPSRKQAHEPGTYLKVSLSFKDPETVKMNNDEVDQIIKIISSNSLASKNIGTTGILPAFVCNDQRGDFGRCVLFFRLAYVPLAQTNKLKKIFSDVFIPYIMNWTDIVDFGFKVFVVNYPWHAITEN